MLPRLRRGTVTLLRFILECVLKVGSAFFAHLRVSTPKATSQMISARGAVHVSCVTMNYTCEPAVYKAKPHRWGARSAVNAACMPILALPPAEGVLILSCICAHVEPLISWPSRSHSSLYHSVTLLPRYASSLSRLRSIHHEPHAMLRRNASSSIMERPDMLHMVSNLPEPSHVPSA